LEIWSAGYFKEIKKCGLVGTIYFTEILTARMRKYGESKTTRIMMATVPHVTSGLGLRKFQADGCLLT